MGYFCDVCDKSIRPKSKYKLFKSNDQNQVDRCKHIELMFENPNINNIDEIFHAYIIEHNKKYD